MKRIGIFLPAITDLLQDELIQSVCESAFPCGCDVIVMTNTTHADTFDFQNDYTTGEENVYSLIENGVFDGVLYVSQYFHKPELQAHIESMIRAAGIPCVEIGDTVPDFAHVSVSQRQAFFEITEHLITVHGCRDLCCLTGPETIPDAQERLAGFLDAAEKYGIEIADAQIIYGDFWKDSGERLGREIAAGQRKKPEAIVCTNDMMAVSLCDALAEGGISVPEEILVTGYDAHLEALSHFPSVTTVGGQSREIGRLAAEMLCAMMEGTPMPQGSSHLKLIFGASCGCIDRSADYQQAAVQVQQFIRDEARKTRMLEIQTNANYIAAMSEVQSLEELMRTADATSHIITGHTGIDICICHDWAGDLRHPEQYRSAGYPSEMLLALSNRLYENEASGYRFATSALTPALQKEHAPLLLFVMPLHHIRRVFGYCVSSYAEGVRFRLTTLLPSWLDAIANGLRTLQKRLYTEYLREKVERASMYDLMSGLYSKKGILRQLSVCAEQGRRYMLLLMTVRQLVTERITETQQTLDLQVDAEMMITNALRLMLHSDDAAAHLSENVFLLLTPIPASKDVSAFAEQVTMRLETLIKKTQDTLSASYLPAMMYHAAEITDYTEDFLSQQIGILLQKASASPQKTDYAEQLSRLRREIFNTPQSDWSVDTVAGALCISRSYLQKMYKQQFGVTFIDDVINARLLKAKLLLTTTNLRIHEIAEQCGYNNPTHFMRQFRSKVGMTAAEYRESGEARA